MLHDIASFSFGKMEEIRADFKECERLTNLIFELLDVKCNKSPGYFKKVFADHKHADIYLDSQQAKVHGLIDQVGYPVLVPCIQMELILSENTIEEPKKKGRKKKNI
jgi:ATP-dependent protease ClpP protease subunit